VRFHGSPIPLDYALVEVAWTDNHHDEDELDFANEEGDTTLGRALGTVVLWNKGDIVFYMPKSATKTSQPSPSPPGGPSHDDDDDNGGNGNGDDGGHVSTTPSPRSDTSNPQGGTRGEPGHQTPPPSQSQGKCPHMPKKTEAEGDKPATQLTNVERAVWDIAEEYQYTTVFERCIC
jgi:hypothetical protein